MGGTRWSDDHYKERAAFRAREGKTAFEYDAEVKRGETVAQVHQKLNPFGIQVREARDSEAHPEAHAVSVLFDVTGSMQSVPRILQANLPKLMGLLIRKGYLEHPAIMVGAIGDATSDQAPLQIGQFEAGIEIEDDLTKLYLEGGGGPSITESYELAMYFMARHTALDCHEKRNRRGYLFLIGDEIPYPRVSRALVERVLGDQLQADIPTEEILAELEKRYEVYFILPRMTNHWNNESVRGRWVQLLGQNVLRLEDPAGICELIASTIGIAEGKVDFAHLADDLKEAGTNETVTRAVSEALAVVAEKGGKGRALAIPDAGPGSGLAEL